jgi:hypothetical protein
MEIVLVGSPKNTTFATEKEKNYEPSKKIQL